VRIYCESEAYRGDAPPGRPAQTQLLDSRRTDQLHLRGLLRRGRSYLAQYERHNGASSCPAGRPAAQAYNPSFYDFGCVEPPGAIERAIRHASFA
jgi:hypothetical protein